MNFGYFELYIQIRTSFIYPWNRKRPYKQLLYILVTHHGKDRIDHCGKNSCGDFVDNQLKSHLIVYNIKSLYASKFSKRVIIKSKVLF